MPTTASPRPQPKAAKQPTPLMVARAQRDEAKAEASALSRLLFDLATGKPKDAFAMETGDDGWTFEASLHRAMAPDGGLLVVVRRDPTGKACDVQGGSFEAFHSYVQTLPFSNHLPEHLVLDRLAVARQALWDASAQVA